MADIFDNTGEEMTPFSPEGDEGQGQTGEPSAEGGAEQPNATETETEPAPAPEGNTGSEPEGQAGGTETKGWQSEYKSPEEMYSELQKTKKSYDHLRPKFTQVTQELSKLRNDHIFGAPQQGDNQQADPQQPQPDYQQPQPDYQQPQLAPADQILMAVKSMVEPLQMEQAQLKMENEVARLAKNYKDFDEVAPDMQEILKQTPQLWNVPDTLDVAYQLARARKLEAEMQTAVGDATNKAYQNKELKVITGGEKPKPAGGTQQKTPEQEILDDIIGAGGIGDNLFGF